MLRIGREGDVENALGAFTLNDAVDTEVVVPRPAAQGDPHLVRQSLPIGAELHLIGTLIWTNPLLPHEHVRLIRCREDGVGDPPVDIVPHRVGDHLSEKRLRLTIDHPSHLSILALAVDKVAAVPAGVPQHRLFVRRERAHRFDLHPRLTSGGGGGGGEQQDQDQNPRRLAKRHEKRLTSRRSSGKRIASMHPCPPSGVMRLTDPSIIRLA